MNIQTTTVSDSQVFGPENPQPSYKSRADVEMENAQKFGQRHVKMLAKIGGKMFLKIAALAIAVAIFWVCAIIWMA
jgi:NaMN:DMB phosphoribosyltransferase